MDSGPEVGNGEGERLAAIHVARIAEEPDACIRTVLLLRHSHLKSTIGMGWDGDRMGAAGRRRSLIWPRDGDRRRAKSRVAGSRRRGD
jgi:hypothetical protein